MHRDFDTIVHEEAYPKLEYAALSTELEEVCVLEQEDMEYVFPLKPTTISEEQQKDKQLLKEVKKDKSNRYTTNFIEKDPPTHFDGKVVLPRRLQERSMEWYHTYLVHPGTKSRL